MMSNREPAINATIRAVVNEALAKGIPPTAVRTATVNRFVDSFAESSVASDFVDPYRKQVTAVVDATIENWAREARTA
jgi:hypothetical protein